MTRAVGVACREVEYRSKFTSPIVFSGRCGTYRAPQPRRFTMTDERKDRENKPATESDEHVSDLKSKKLDRDEEGKVKGGGAIRPKPDLLT